MSCVRLTDTLPAERALLLLIRKDSLLSCSLHLSIRLMSWVCECYIVFRLAHQLQDLPVFHFLVWVFTRILLGLYLLWFHIFCLVYVSFVLLNSCVILRADVINLRWFYVLREGLALWPRLTWKVYRCVPAPSTASFFSSF